MEKIITYENRLKCDTCLEKNASVFFKKNGKKSCLPCESAPIFKAEE